MYILSISYKMALDGAYKKTTPIPDPFGLYFSEGGTSVHHNTFRAPDLELTNDPLFNVVKLIYYVKKIGYQQLNLSLDDQETYDSITDRFYLISSLPEVIASISGKQLFIKYDENCDPLKNLKNAGMSIDDIMKMFDDALEGKDIDVALPIPDEIKKKFEVSAPKLSREELEKALKLIEEGINEFNAILDED